MQQSEHDRLGGTASPDPNCWCDTELPNPGFGPGLYVPTPESTHSHTFIGLHSLRGVPVAVCNPIETCFSVDGDQTACASCRDGAVGIMYEMLSSGGVFPILPEVQASSPGMLLGSLASDSSGTSNPGPTTRPNPCTCTNETEHQAWWRSSEELGTQIPGLFSELPSGLVRTPSRRSIISAGFRLITS